MLIFLKFVDETKMPKPQEYTNIFIVTKKLFLVGIGGLQSISNPVERPCNIIFQGITSNALTRYNPLLWRQREQLSQDLMLK